MQSLKRFMNYNFYFASLYTFLRYQPKKVPGSLKKLAYFSGGIIPGFGVAKVDAWSLFKQSKEKTKEQADKAGIKLRDYNDADLLNDLIETDAIYEEDLSQRQTEIYDRLYKHRSKKEPELLWRLARITYEKTKKMKVPKEREQALHEAYSMVQASLELEEENFSAHKWMAILLNEVSVLKGLKEQIVQSENVKKHMLRAKELNPTDATSTYLLGAWCFSVAEVPWYQRKAAETFVAKPPTCEFAEALQHFLDAEAAKPLFYSMNLLMLAKSYIQLGDYESAEKYLITLRSYVIRSDDDLHAREQGYHLLETVRKKLKK